RTSKPLTLNCMDVDWAIGNIVSISLEFMRSHRADLESVQVGDLEKQAAVHRHVTAGGWGRCGNGLESRFLEQGAVPGVGHRAGDQLVGRENIRQQLALRAVV